MECSLHKVHGMTLVSAGNYLNIIAHVLRKGHKKKAKAKEKKRGVGGGGFIACILQSKDCCTKQLP